MVEKKQIKRTRKPKPADMVSKESSWSIPTWLLIAGLAVLVFILFANTLIPGHLIDGSDQLLSGYMFKNFAVQSIKAGEGFPLWNPYIFGGLPYVDAMHGDLFYITMLLRLVFSISAVMALVFILHIIVAGAGMLFFLMEIRIKKPVAFIGAVAYMFTGVIVSYVLAGHDSKVIIISLLPWAMLLIHRGFRLNRILEFALLGLVFGLGLISPNIQMMYYTFLICGFYVLYRVYIARKDRKPTAKPFLYSIGAVLAGVGISAVQMLPAISYLPFSPRSSGGRGWEFASSWSMPRSELFDIINPRFSGILQHYWGANAFKQHSEYFGIIILALMIVGLILAWRKRETRFFAAFSLFGLLMALGGNTPFYRIPYYILPMIKSFRAPAIIFFTLTFSAVVIASLGLQQALEAKKVEKKKKKRANKDVFNIVFAALIALVSLLALWATASPDSFAAFSQFLTKGEILKAQGQQIFPMLMSKMRANVGNAANGFWLATIFLSAVWLTVYMWRRSPKLKWLWSFMLAALVFLDLWMLDRHFVNIVRDQNGNPVSAEVLYAPDEVVNFLKQDRGLYRVCPLQFRGNDLYRRDSYLMLHGIQSLGGYHGNQLGRYQEFIGASGTIMFQNAKNLRYPTFLNALDVAYLISLRLPPKEELERYSPQDRQTILAFYNELAPWIDTSISSFRPVYSGQRYQIYKNTARHERAWLCSNVEFIADSNKILARMKQASFDPLKTVILEETPENWKPSADTSSAGSVKITSYHPNHISVSAKLKRPAMLVLSENYYPYYRVWVNGTEQKVYRADFTLRAVALKAGDHKVEFRFKSPYLTAGLLITIGVLLLLTAIVIFSLIKLRKRRK